MDNHFTRSIPDINLFWKRQICQITQTAIFVKWDTLDNIAIFSIGTKFVPSECCADCPLLFLGTLEAHLVVTEMLLSLAISHSKRATHPSLNMILTFSGIYSHSKTQTISLDRDLRLLVREILFPWKAILCHTVKQSGKLPVKFPSAFWTDTYIPEVNYLS